MDSNTLTAITTLIAALTAAVVAIIAAIQSKNNGKKVDAVKSEVSAVADQAAEIHQATDGNLSRINNDNKVLLARLEELEKALAAQKLSSQQAALAAKQAASDVQDALECPPQ